MLVQYKVGVGVKLNANTFTSIFYLGGLTFTIIIAGTVKSSAFNQNAGLQTVPKC